MNSGIICAQICSNKNTITPVQRHKILNLVHWHNAYNMTMREILNEMHRLKVTGET